MTNSNRDILHVSRNVLTWLINEGMRLVVAGIGSPTDEEEGFTPGIIDDVGMDTPAYTFISAMIQYVRLVVSILEQQEE